eukprot:gene19225-52930_t
MWSFPCDHSRVTLPACSNAGGGAVHSALGDARLCAALFGAMLRDGT